MSEEQNISPEMFAVGLGEFQKTLDIKEKKLFEHMMSGLQDMNINKNIKKTPELKLNKTDLILAFWPHLKEKDIAKHHHQRLKEVMNSLNEKMKKFGDYIPSEEMTVEFSEEIWDDAV